MVLYINTKDKNTILVILKKGDVELDSLSDENKYGSQVLLQLIFKLLKKNNYEPIASGGYKLEGIEVETGPGSYTGLRVGVSVANALGFALGIPVNGKKMETELVYG